MKTILSFLVVLLILAGCIGMIACGEPDDEPEMSTPGGQEEEEAPPPTDEEEEEEEEEEDEAPPPSGGGFTWNDMPVYPGAKQIQKGSWSIPPQEGEWSKTEWRYYESNASVGTIVDYYKSEMTENGWENLMWMEMEEVSWAMYHKNNEQDGAMIWVAADNGDTVFSLMRGR